MLKKKYKIYTHKKKKKRISNALARSMAKSCRLLKGRLFWNTIFLPVYPWPLYVLKSIQVQCIFWNCCLEILVPFKITLNRIIFLSEGFCKTKKNWL